MHETRTIVISMTPTQLRKLADKMEYKYPRMLPGDTTFIDFLGYSDTLKVCLHVDQSRMIKEKEEI